MPVSPFIHPNSQPLHKRIGLVAFSLLLTGALSQVASPLTLAAEHKSAHPPAVATPIKKSIPTPVKKGAAAKTPEEKKANKEALSKEVDASIAAATKVDPLLLLQKPDQYVNHKVTFTGTFNRFADIGLDYKKAFRDSRDYVTFFILRPDVAEHTIPLSEMKLFFPRKQSDEVMELEAGDKIQIVGTLFSAALDEPWLDVAHVKILEKTAKPERKHGSEF